jgi:hypothetical protein
MKFTQVAMIVLIAVAMMFVAGCTSSEAPKYEDPDAALKASIASQKAVAAGVAAYENTVHVESKEAHTDKYNRAEVTGIIHNGKNTDVKVFGYVDFYVNDVKVDDCIFSAAPDAEGKATFDASTSKTNGKAFTYTVSITDVYKA